MVDHPLFEKIGVEDMVDFCRIVDAIDDPRNTAKTYKSVEERLQKESRFTRLPPISNVSDRLSKLSIRLYGKPGRLIHAAKRTGDAKILDEGRQLYALSKSVLSLIDKFKTEGVQDVNRTLTISCAMAFASRILPLLLADYLKRSYFRRISILERTKVREIFREVSLGAADLGICVDAEEHTLHQTELFRAGRGILVGERYPAKKKLESRRDLADEIVITFQPRSLQRVQLDDVFPDPSPSGVRISAESESTILGWVSSHTAIGHSYTGAVPTPTGTKFVLSNLVQDKPEVRWYAYTVFPSEGESGEPRQKEIAKVIRAMKTKARELGLPS